MSEARKLFDESSELDIVSWNSIIVNCSECGEVDEVIRLFDRMPSRNLIFLDYLIFFNKENVFSRCVLSTKGEIEEKKLNIVFSNGRLLI